MFSDDFFGDLGQQQDDDEAKEAPKRPKSPPRSCEDWLSSEGITQWPCSTRGDAEERPKPDDILGTLDDIRTDLMTHSPWDTAFLDGIEGRLQTLETTLCVLADQFISSHSAPESVTGGIAIIKDMTFLTELCDTNLLSSRRMRKKSVTKDNSEGKAVESAVYPGISLGSNTVPFPANLEALPLLDLVTKSAVLPPYIMKSWCKVFYSDASCSLLQNTFWYIWLSYFKPKPDPVEQSRLFTVISENFVALLHLMELKHKDEVFVHYPESLAQAVYSAFCHAFVASNKIFNSDHFLSFLTNLTSEWIAGVGSPPGSWKSWPRYLLNPYHSIKNIGSDPTSDRESASRRTPFSEKDVLKLSIQAGHHAGRERTMSRTATRRTTAHKPTAKATNIPKDQEVGVGPGPTFECVRFSLMGRSPLLQHYLVIHGLVEEGDGEEMSRAVVGRTQIKKLPTPTVTYKQLLQSSAAAAKRNYSRLEREMAKTDQEISAARKKQNALLRASDRRNERLLKHRHEVAILAEKIMSKYRTTELKLNRTNTSPPTSGPR